MKRRCKYGPTVRSHIKTGPLLRSISSCRHHSSNNIHMKIQCDRHLFYLFSDGTSEPHKLILRRGVLLHERSSQRKISPSLRASAIETCGMRCMTRTTRGGHSLMSFHSCNVKLGTINLAFFSLHFFLLVCFGSHPL